MKIRITRLEPEYIDVIADGWASGHVQDGTTVEAEIIHNEHPMATITILAKIDAEITSIDQAKEVLMELLEVHRG